MISKRCSRCGEEHPIEVFPSAPTPDGYAPWCRPCFAEYARDRRASLKSQGKAIQGKPYKERDPNIYRRAHLKKLYGISLEDYDAMWEHQGGVCVICLEPEQLRQFLSVDHCHETGAVRGLLCNKCNTGLGKFNDDPILLARAVDYLK